MSHSASKDVEMKDSTVVSKEEDKKAPEPVDPFFGKFKSIINTVWNRIQEGDGADGES